MEDYQKVSDWLAMNPIFGQVAKATLPCRSAKQMIGYSVYIEGESFEYSTDAFSIDVFAKVLDHSPIKRHLKIFIDFLKNLNC